MRTPSLQYDSGLPAEVSGDKVNFSVEGIVNLQYDSGLPAEVRFGLPWAIDDGTNLQYDSGLPAEVSFQGLETEFVAVGEPSI